MKQNWKKNYSELAKLVASWSKCKKLQVGAVLISEENRVITVGVNGTLSDTCNECEDSEGKTKFGVFHAEENVLLECLRQGKSSKNSIMFVTHTPCIQCSKLIAGAGIKEVYYLEDYFDNRGLNGTHLLELFNIKVEKLNEI